MGILNKNLFHNNWNNRNYIFSSPGNTSEKRIIYSGINFYSSGDNCFLRLLSRGINGCDI